MSDVILVNSGRYSRRDANKKSDVQEVINGTVAGQDNFTGEALISDNSGSLISVATEGNPELNEVASVTRSNSENQGRRRFTQFAGIKVYSKTKGTNSGETAEPEVDPCAEEEEELLDLDNNTPDIPPNLEIPPEFLLPEIPPESEQQIIPIAGCTNDVFGANWYASDHPTQGCPTGSRYQGTFTKQDGSYLLLCSGSNLPPGEECPEEPRWACVGGECIEQDGGIYASQAECEASGCEEPVLGWDCVEGFCREVDGGTYATQLECESICVQRWDCISGVCTQVGSEGQFDTLAECQASGCENVVTPLNYVSYGVLFRVPNVNWNTSTILDGYGTGSWDYYLLSAGGLTQLCTMQHRRAYTTVTASNDNGVSGDLNFSVENGVFPGNYTNTLTPSAGNLTLNFTLGADDVISGASGFKQLSTGLYFDYSSAFHDEVTKDARSYHIYGAKYTGVTFDPAQQGWHEVCKLGSFTASGSSEGDGDPGSGGNLEIFFESSAKFDVLVQGYSLADTYHDAGSLQLTEQYSADQDPGASYLYLQLSHNLVTTSNDLVLFHTNLDFAYGDFIQFVVNANYSTGGSDFNVNTSGSIDYDLYSFYHRPYLTVTPSGINVFINHNSNEFFYGETTATPVSDRGTIIPDIDDWRSPMISNWADGRDSLPAFTNDFKDSAGFDYNNGRFSKTILTGFNTYYQCTAIDNNQLVSATDADRLITVFSRDLNATGDAINFAGTYQEWPTQIQIPQLTGFNAADIEVIGNQAIFVITIIWYRELPTDPWLTFTGDHLRARIVDNGGNWDLEIYDKTVLVQTTNYSNEPEFTIIDPT